MPQSHNGYSTAEEIDSPTDGVKFLGIEGEVTEEKVSEAFSDLATELHPDQGGTTELFKALQNARDFALEITGVTVGDVSGSPPGGSAGAGRTTDREDVFTADDFRDLKNVVEQTIKSEFTQEELFNNFGPNATYEEMAKVMATFVVNGQVDLGDVVKILKGEQRFGGRGIAGGDDRFGSKGGGGDGRFGGRRGRGGDDRFGF